MEYDPKRALQLLRQGTGLAGGAFRDDQEESIRHLVENRGRLLVVEPTGWGKSNVYFIATKLLREAGSGPTLLISPLLALMRNQILQAERMGIRAETINSNNPPDWPEIEGRLRNDEVDILLISPERLGNEGFRSGILAQIAPLVTMLVIDEAHCISDWGHDFRPDYRLIERTMRNLTGNVRLLGTTATANKRVRDDLEIVMGPDLTTIRGNLNRPSLHLQTITMPQQSERLAWLAERLKTLEGSGIIYTLTKRHTKRVADWLKLHEIIAEPYTSDTPVERRIELEKALLANEVKALVATTALGMGFDKPDLGFVIHYQTPGSVVAYYQQVGRAGRAIDAAYGVLFGGNEDTNITGYFIENAFPLRDEVQLVMGALEVAPEGLSIPGLMNVINVKKGRIEQTLKLLSLESPSPIAKEGTRWQLTPSTLSEEFWGRAERLTELRYQEQQQMQEYLDLSEGHMEFLIRALDGDVSGIELPVLPDLPTEVDPDLVIAATEFLNRAGRRIEPRKQWPAGGLPQSGLRGNIPEALRAQSGKVLSVWGDPGWSDMVRQGKNRDGHYSDDLVAACARVVAQWSPEPPPAWVTCIPSRRHTSLVPDFARRLATGLGLPFHEVLEKTDDRPTQKSMQNSNMQAQNVDGSMDVTGTMPSGPVLLVDDMVDSRWTLTYAAWLLLSNGSGEVFPLALADTGMGE